MDDRIDSLDLFNPNTKKLAYRCKKKYCMNMMQRLSKISRLKYIPFSNLFHNKPMNIFIDDITRDSCYPVKPSFKHMNLYKTNINLFRYYVLAKYSQNSKFSFKDKYVNKYPINISMETISEYRDKGEVEI